MLSDHERKWLKQKARDDVHSKVYGSDPESARVHRRLDGERGRIYKDYFIQEQEDQKQRACQEV